jgi:hypothetical protein
MLKMIYKLLFLGKRTDKETFMEVYRRFVDLAETPETGEAEVLLHKVLRDCKRSKEYQQGLMCLSWIPCEDDNLAMDFLCNLPATDETKRDWPRRNGERLYMKQYRKVFAMS